MRTCFHWMILTMLPPAQIFSVANKAIQPCIEMSIMATLSLRLEHDGRQFRWFRHRLVTTQPRISFQLHWNTVNNPGSFSILARQLLECANGFVSGFCGGIVMNGKPQLRMVTMFMTKSSKTQQKRCHFHDLVWFIRA